MMRRLLRFSAASGLVAAVVILVRRTVSLREESRHVVPSPDPWRPIREADLLGAGKGAATAPAAPSGAAPAEAPAGGEAPATAASSDGWLPPTQDGSAPTTHPIKAKTSSHLYHLPGMVNYGRTNPDRWYASEEAARADGFNKAKR